MPAARVLLLLADGFEEIETITPIDLLRRADIEVTTAAIGSSIHVTGRSGITIHADTQLSALDTPTAFDSLILPGGPAVAALRHDQRPADLARSYAAAGKWVAAICAAPLILQDAGLLDGIPFTAHQSTHTELTAALSTEHPIVISAPIITSPGAGTAIPFSLGIIAQLTNQATADSIRTAIHA